MFRNFSTITEDSKNNSKACFCFSMARRLPGIAKKYRKGHRNNFHLFTIPQASRFTQISKWYRTCVPEVTVSEMKGFTWGLIGLGYGCDSRVCSWEVFEDMPLGVLKWRGGLRGVSSESCEPVKGVARMLKWRLWEQGGCRDLWLQWKWWLAHRLRPLKLQKEMEEPSVKQTGHFCSSIWCLY